MAMTEKTQANLGRDQPHFDLPVLQLQLQSDDDREPATLIRPNALHVELSAVRNGNLDVATIEAVASGMPRDEQCGTKISVSQ
jgi:hypothetical protein